MTGYNKATTISEECLRRLPYGTLVEFTTVHDMEGVKRDAILWSFTDQFGEFDKAFFDEKTGEYITH